MSARPEIKSLWPLTVQQEVLRALRGCLPHEDLATMRLLPERVAEQRRRRVDRDREIIAVDISVALERYAVAKRQSAAQHMLSGPSKADIELWLNGLQTPVNTLKRWVFAAVLPPVERRLAPSEATFQLREIDDAGIRWLGQPLIPTDIFSRRIQRSEDQELLQSWQQELQNSGSSLTPIAVIAGLLALEQAILLRRARDTRRAELIATAEAHTRNRGGRARQGRSVDVLRNRLEADVAVALHRHGVACDASLNGTLMRVLRVVLPIAGQKVPKSPSRRLNAAIAASRRLIAGMQTESF